MFPHDLRRKLRIAKVKGNQQQLRRLWNGKEFLAEGTHCMPEKKLKSFSPSVWK